MRKRQITIEDLLRNALKVAERDRSCRWKMLKSRFSWMSIFDRREKWKCTDDCIFQEADGAYFSGKVLRTG